MSIITFPPKIVEVSQSSKSEAEEKIWWKTLWRFPCFPVPFFLVLRGIRLVSTKSIALWWFIFGSRKGVWSLSVWKKTMGHQVLGRLQKDKIIWLQARPMLSSMNLWGARNNEKHRRHVINSNLFPCTADWFRPKPNHSHKKRYHPKTSNPPEKPNNPLKPLRQLVHQSSILSLFLPQQKTNTLPGWLHAHAPWCGWKWYRVHCRSSHGWRDQVAKTTKRLNLQMHDILGWTLTFGWFSLALRPHFGILIFK